MTDRLTIHVGDCLDVLRGMADGCVHACVTSPPYWGLRDYGVDSQIGLEQTPEAYVANLVAVFREVKRVLRSDGVCFVNLGDSYARQAGPEESKYATKHTLNVGQIAAYDAGVIPAKKNVPPQGLKPKDIVGIPWRVAFALQADGWYLRSDIIWAKPNPMPESVTDRPTKSHEYVFLLSKSARYYYDAEAVKEEAAESGWSKGGDWDDRERLNATGAQNRWGGNTRTGSFYRTSTRNRRSVWTIATQPFPEAHFATFPEELPRTCILAGTSERGACPECGKPWGRVVERERAVSKPCPKQVAAHHARGGVGMPVGTVGQSGSGRIDGHTRTIGWSPSCKCGHDETAPCIVLDPFLGSGTTALVALKCGRHAVGIELNPEYAAMARRRCTDVLAQGRLDI